MKGTRKLKTIPAFKSESEERDFWAHEDSTDYVDWTQAERAVFPHLKPSTRTISLRLPMTILGHLKLLANKRDVPYQSLLKVFLAERLDREIVANRPPTSGRPKRRSR